MIDGKTILLRTLEMKDAPELYAAMNNPNITKFLAYMRPYTFEEEEEFVRRSWGEIRDGKGYYLAIVEKKTGELIGSVALFNIDPVNRVGEFGIWLKEEHWNRGFGTEAEKLMLKFGFKDLNLNCIKAGVLEFNKHSLEIFRKIGMKETGRTREAILRNNKHFDLIWFDMLKKEFKE